RFGPIMRRPTPRALWCSQARWPRSPPSLPPKRRARSPWRIIRSTQARSGKRVPRPQRAGASAPSGEGCERLADRALAGRVIHLKGIKRLGTERGNELALSGIFVAVIALAAFAEV